MMLAERIIVNQTFISPFLKGYFQCCSFHIFVYSIERPGHMQLQLQSRCWLLAPPLIKTFL